MIYHCKSKVDTSDGSRTIYRRRSKADTSDGSRTIYHHRSKADTSDGSRMIYHQRSKADTSDGSRTIYHRRSKADTSDGSTTINFQNLKRKNFGQFHNDHPPRLNVVTLDGSETVNAEVFHILHQDIINGFILANKPSNTFARW